MNDTGSVGLVEKSADANADDIKKVRDRALLLLARREHSAKELIAKLGQKTELSESIIRQVVSLLADNGYQSDFRFTDMYLRSQLNKNYGPLKILYDLNSYGIAEKDANVAIESAQIDWVNVAIKALDKKYAKKALPQDVKVAAYRFLKLRGFQFFHIELAFKRWLPHC